jgi:outer membrane protein assembly factor BamB
LARATRREVPASPVHADGRIYLQSEDGEGIVVKDGTEFEVLARNPLGTRALASYAVADGAIFPRSRESLYRLAKKE